MKKFQTFRITEEHQGLTVEQYLKSILQCPGRKIQKLTRAGGVRLNKRNAYLQKKIKSGDILDVLVLEDQFFGVKPEPGSIDILFEDPALIILYKPAGMLVHPAGQTTGGTLANYLAEYFRENGETITIRPLHRLDRDTTGCVVFAKDARTQSELEKQLQDGRLKRKYYAVVRGRIEPPSGSVDASIGPHPTLPNRRAVHDQGERALTHYNTIKTFENYSLLELTLETGRTHQIRVHLSSRGHPVLGDRMYGKRSSLIPRQALHARSVSFCHPMDGKLIEIQAPVPPDLENLISHLSL